MNPRFLSVLCVALLALHASSLPASAQASAESDGSQSAYTFHANSRVVLTDVTVMDRKGNPVHGLKASDFHVFDNNKPQEIASFEEHRGDDVAPSVPRVLPAGVFSNDYLAHPPHVLNILFIDLTNIEIADQMYLNHQLGKFFDTLKPDEPVAIYARPGNVSILLQGFTSDPARLRAAVKKTASSLPAARAGIHGRLRDAAAERRLPGSVARPQKCSMAFRWIRHPSAARRSAQGCGEWRTIYDELETQRIAIYPIDVRGLAVASVSLNARGQSTVDRTATMPQHGLMNEVAEPLAAALFITTMESRRPWPILSTRVESITR
jgi:VWFA-related protein